MLILFYILLTFHILCGTISLLSAFSALSVTKGQTWHRRFGRCFFYGMSGVFVTAIPMALIKDNVFLFLIAIFSYYLALTGWRYATNTSGVPRRIDWVVSSIMLTVSLIMIAVGCVKWSAGGYQTTVLWVFGAIGATISFSDLQGYRRGGPKGKERIIKHFSAMIGATIAATTAFVVVNVHLQPEIILWLGPTIILVPVIFWWRVRVKKWRNNF